jgi:hypothetical protein
MILLQTVIGFLGYFISVIAHELGHYSSARYLGYTAHLQITTPFSGTTKIEGLRDPYHDQLITLAGPIFQLTFLILFGIMMSNTFYIAVTPVVLLSIVLFWRTLIVSNGSDGEHLQIYFFPKYYKTITLISFYTLSLAWVISFLIYPSTFWFLITLIAASFFSIIKVSRQKLKEVLLRAKFVHDFEKGQL